MCKVNVSEVTVKSVPSEHKASYTLLSISHQVAASHSQCSGKLESCKLEGMGSHPPKGRTTSIPQECHRGYELEAHYMDTFLLLKTKENPRPVSGSGVKSVGSSSF